MRTNLKKMTAVVGATLAVAATAVVTSAGTANAFPPAAPYTGPVTLTITNATFNPSSGTNAQNFTLSFGTTQVCPGDATTGWRWQSFITPYAQDPGLVTYSASGAPTGTAPTLSLRDLAGGNVRAENPGLGTADVIPGDPGAVSGGGFTLNNAGFASLTAGQYWLGLACTNNGLFGTAVQKYWTTPVTITGTGPSYTIANGIVPDAPAITTVTPGDQSLAVAFTHAASTPATTSYSLTGTGPGGPFLVSGASSPLTLTGLTNGSLYNLSLVANNIIGPSLADTDSGTPAPPARPAVTGLTATPGTGNVTLNWTVPSGVAPTGYSITVSPNPGGSPYTPSPATNTTITISGTPGTNYLFTVTPLHPSPYTALPASISATPNAAQVLIQEVSVTRPAGALILTQKCGAYGALPAFTAQTGFPGFPRNLLATAADGPGSAPYITPGGPATDPNFADYPNPQPAAYPTYCGLSLGTASLITNSVDPTTAGQYYTAHGKLNQVTVLDTRDIDAGWTITGTMSNFTTSGDSFDGDYLGWVPVVTDTSNATAFYTPVVTPGSPVLPGEGTSSGTGLGSGKVLASAAAGAGLGETVLDARVNLMIPVTANAGLYNGTLTLTAISA